MQKTFYVSAHLKSVLEALDEILHKKDMDFCHWIQLQAEEYLEAERPKDPEKVEPPKAKCEFPRLKKQGLNCEWVVCPFIDRTYGELAQKRQFAGKEKCLYRFRGEVS